MGISYTIGDMVLKSDSVPGSAARYVISYHIGTTEETRSAVSSIGGWPRELSASHGTCMLNLRHTSLTLERKDIRSAGFDHPFFWAAFILMGEAE